jgi:two-component system, OmpR family, sensor kinase
MTLRRRLILSIIGIVVGLSVVIGTVSVLLLQSSLYGQLDKQLDSSITRAQRVLLSQGNGGGISSEGLVNGPGQAPGTITVIVVGGKVGPAGRVDDNGAVQPFSAEATNSLLSLKAQKKAEVIDLGESGRYLVRALAITAHSTPVDAQRGTLVVGLPIASVDTTVRNLIVIILVVTLIGLAVSIALALLVVGYALEPLQRMAATASRVAELRLDRGDVALDARVEDADTDTRTEVGRVGDAMNRMLGHVAQALTARQESENKVRQFVADASHELRTPLASVRGYAELTRRMGKDLPEDVVYAMSRIESESLRMTSLVEELLLLARLDEGTDLKMNEVDLTKIVLDAVHDIHVSSTGHRFEVSVPEEPISVQGDAMRLHQVVTNLLNNARTHTPEGTEVWVLLSRDEATHEAVITVADNGPGIDTAVMPILFERFARADSSRSRKAGSTGLGLAIVQAVVHSHRGTVVATPGDPGAVFTVRLPLEQQSSPVTAAPRSAPTDARI